MHLAKLGDCPLDLDRATAIAASGFGRPPSDDLRSDVAAHLAGADLVYVFKDTQDSPAVGFAIFNIWDDILYLSGIILADAYQCRRSLETVLGIVRARLPHLRYLALRTQSPRMWRSAAPLCQEWYPKRHTGFASLPDELATIGAKVAAAIGSAFPVATGYYGGPLYGDRARPVHHDERLQSWWDELCNAERGDAVICIGRLA